MLDSGGSAYEISQRMTAVVSGYVHWMAYTISAVYHVLNHQLIFATSPLTKLRTGALRMKRLPETHKSQIQKHSKTWLSTTWCS
jgi:hypothetical protein